MAKFSPQLFLIAVLLASCVSSDKQEDNSQLMGDWRFEMDLGGRSLPFIMRMADDSAMSVLTVINGNEVIRAEKVTVTGDSISVRMPVFNTEIRGAFSSDSTIEGFFTDHSRSGDYRIPISGKKGSSQRFDQDEAAAVDISGKWAVGFSPGTAEAYPAIGVFKQNGNRLEGTFLTTTGDFRFLEGTVSGDSVFLSGFDGALALLFRAKVSGDSIQGRFYSGIHWKESWAGVRNEAARLPDPEALTFMRPGYDRFDFTFPDLDGNMVSLRDPRFRGKVVIVQVMGSWCPNCLDETTFLVDLYGRFNSEGLEIVALGFERGKDDPERIANLRRLREHFPIPYPILLAGGSSKAEASEKLPMLSHVLSYPTTIFVDRKGRVRRIHTGFSGPGTGEHYLVLTERTEALVSNLLEEKAVF